MYKYILYIKQMLFIRWIYFYLPQKRILFKLKRNPLGEEPGGLRVLLGFCLLLCFGILRQDQQHVNKFLFLFSLRFSLRNILTSRLFFILAMLYHHKHFTHQGPMSSSGWAPGFLPFSLSITVFTMIYWRELEICGYYIKLIHFQDPRPDRTEPPASCQLRSQPS